MAIPGERWCAADSESAPDEVVSVEDAQVVEVAFPEVGSVLADSLGEMTFVFVLIEAEAALDDEVRSDLDGRMALPLRGCWSCALRLGPCHHFQVENVEVVEEVLAVPASENEHLGPPEERGRVGESCRRRP